MEMKSDGYTCQRCTDLGQHARVAAVSPAAPNSRGDCKPSQRPSSQSALSGRYDWLASNSASRWAIHFAFMPSTASAVTKPSAPSRSTYTSSVGGDRMALYITGCVNAGSSLSLWSWRRKQNMSTTTGLPKVCAVRRPCNSACQWQCAAAYENGHRTGLEPATP